MVQLANGRLDLAPRGGPLPVLRVRHSSLTRFLRVHYSTPSGRFWWKVTAQLRRMSVRCTQDLRALVAGDIPGPAAHALVPVSDGLWITRYFGERPSVELRFEVQLAEIGHVAVPTRLAPGSPCREDAQGKRQKPQGRSGRS